MDKEELTQACSVGFIDYSGIKMTKAENGYAEGYIDILPHHLNPGGALHGGLEIGKHTSELQSRI